MSATAEGSLYELVARGNKDAYFFSDTGSEFLFDNSYQAQTPFISELRRVPPISTAEFGRSTEFIFDLVGDIMENPAILINLPTWLPPPQAILNLTTPLQVNEIAFGYTQGIAYFLFENIEFYQDNILLQEFSGDTLWALSKISGTYANRFITMDETGDHDGSALSIQKNATPKQLRLELPLIGCQRHTDLGFPQRAATRHTYRLRCKLRRLEDLVEASDKRAKPTPWNTPTTLAREKIAPLNLQLETQQVYVERDVQDKISKIPLKIRFSRTFDNTFTQSALEYTSVVAGGVSMVKRLIDGRHPASRLIWYFRSSTDIMANRLYSVCTQAGQPYFNRVSLTIGPQAREAPLEPFIWRDLMNYAKEDTDSGVDINTMNWTLGATERFDTDFTGAVNFSTADKPTFYIDLANPGSSTTQLNVIVEGCAEFHTDGKGGAELLSFN